MKTRSSSLFLINPFVVVVLAVALEAQGPLQAALLAVDDIHAKWVFQATGATGAMQTHPAGTLSAANVQVGHGVQTNVAHYTCTLLPMGNGYTLDASTSVAGYVSGVQFLTHADLLFVLTGPADLVVSIGLLLSHGGDFTSSPPFRVDLGDDGTIEVDSGCMNCGSARHHRLWTWDFAAGHLGIRIRTDQQSMGGAQGHSLSLAVQPWIGAASHAAADCGGIAYVASPSNSERESSNYQLAVDEPTQPSQLAVLRAVGLGQVNALVVAMQPGTTPLQLPAPFTSTCPVLANVLLFDVLGPSTTTTAPSGTPWEWQLPVPLLAPGLTFYVQHLSAHVASPFWFGASNIVRIDT
jgi:hypothetical protein